MQRKWMGLVWVLENVILVSRLLSEHCHLCRGLESQALFLRSSSAVGLSGRANSTTGSTAANTARPTVVVIGVDISLNVTATATGVTSKVIEETTKPSIVVTTVAAAAEQASVLLMVSWQPFPPLSPTQLLLLLLIVVEDTGSVLSRALHLTVQLTRTGSGI